MDRPRRTTRSGSQASHPSGGAAPVPAALGSNTGPSPPSAAPTVTTGGSRPRSVSFGQSDLSEVSDDTPQVAGNKRKRKKKKTERTAPPSATGTGAPARAAPRRRAPGRVTVNASTATPARVPTTRADRALRRATTTAEPGPQLAPMPGPAPVAAAAAPAIVAPVRAPVPASLPPPPRPPSATRLPASVGPGPALGPASLAPAPPPQSLPPPLRPPPAAALSAAAGAPLPAPDVIDVDTYSPPPRQPPQRTLVLVSDDEGSDDDMQEVEPPRRRPVPVMRQPRAETRLHQAQRVQRAATVAEYIERTAEDGAFRTQQAPMYDIQVDYDKETLRGLLRMLRDKGFDEFKAPPSYAGLYALRPIRGPTRERSTEPSNNYGLDNGFDNGFDNGSDSPWPEYDPDSFGGTEPSTIHFIPYRATFFIGLLTEDNQVDACFPDIIVNSSQGEALYAQDILTYVQSNSQYTMSGLITRCLGPEYLVATCGEPVPVTQGLPELKSTQGFRWVGSLDPMLTKNSEKRRPHLVDPAVKSAARTKLLHERSSEPPAGHDLFVVYIVEVGGGGDNRTARASGAVLGSSGVRAPSTVKVEDMRDTAAGRQTASSAASSSRQAAGLAVSASGMRVPEAPGAKAPLDEYLAWRCPHAPAVFDRLLSGGHGTVYLHCLLTREMTKLWQSMGLLWPAGTKTPVNGVVDGRTLSLQEVLNWLHGLNETFPAASFQNVRRVESWVRTVSLKLSRKRERTKDEEILLEACEWLLNRPYTTVTEMQLTAGGARASSMKAAMLKRDHDSLRDC